jgi:hypothetical protein
LHIIQVMWVAILRLALVAGLCGSVPVVPRMTAQQQQQAQESSETFSGAVVELTAQRITVSRSILGGAAERRSFLLKPDTRIEGKLRVKARVTVGFINTEEGDVARLIVVREKKKP